LPHYNTVTRKQRCMNRSGADIATVTLRQQEVAKKLTTTPREVEVLEQQNTMRLLHLYDNFMQLSFRTNGRYVNTAEPNFSPISRCGVRLGPDRGVHGLSDPVGRSAGRFFEKFTRSSMSGTGVGTKWDTRRRPERPRRWGENLSKKRTKIVKNH
jgi:hypothetical protein